jgi:hypothetical protein
MGFLNFKILSPNAPICLTVLVSTRKIASINFKSKSSTKNTGITFKICFEIRLIPSGATSETFKRLFNFFKSFNKAKAEQTASGSAF